jgi:hypothetical protein
MPNNQSSAGAGRDGKLRQLVYRWRAEYRRLSQIHATMGTGYHICADELEAFLAVPDPLASDTGQGEEWKAPMHYRKPHTFSSGCGVSSKGGIHWTTDMAYVTCPECIALAPLASSSETQGEKKHETTTI